MALAGGDSAALEPLISVNQPGRIFIARLGRSELTDIMTAVPVRLVCVVGQPGSHLGQGLLEGLNALEQRQPRNRASSCRDLRCAAEPRHCRLSSRGAFETADGPNRLRHAMHNARITTADEV